MTGNDLLKRGLPQIATMMVIIITYTVPAFHELLILFGHKVLYTITALIILLPKSILLMKSVKILI